MTLLFPRFAARLATARGSLQAHASHKELWLTCGVKAMHLIEDSCRFHDQTPLLGKNNQRGLRKPKRNLAGGIGNGAERE